MSDAQVAAASPAAGGGSGHRCPGPVTWPVDSPEMPASRPAVYHQDRGLVMSDLPAEIAGALPFLDYAAGQPRPVQVLIAGLGLGIVPAWLLAHASIAGIDIIEIDADVIGLITRGCRERGAPNQWAADPRLHIHHGDARCAPYPVKAGRRGTRKRACGVPSLVTARPCRMATLRCTQHRFGPGTGRRGEAPRPGSGVKSSRLLNRQVDQR